jgi:hypothetical protein
MTGGQRLISWLHPCSTSNVALNTRINAHGHSWLIQIGPGVTFTPLKKPDVLVGPTHPSSVDSYTTPCAHPRPTRACICPHTRGRRSPAGARAALEERPRRGALVELGEHA